MLFPDLRFDLELEKFGIEVVVLEDVEITRELIGCTEDWEKELKTKKCPVVKARFLTTYKNLSFEYVYGQIFTIFEGNYEFRHGRTGVWQLIGICADEVAEDEPFCPFFAVAMICQVQQSKGIKVPKPPSGSPEERQYDPMEEQLRVSIAFL